MNLTKEILAECRRRGWAVIAPSYRGANNKPQACGSELAVQDVLDAVDYMRKNARIDRKRIYAMGESGGGHMCLTLATRAPEVWAGISTWVGMYDLPDWHNYCKNTWAKRYARDMEAACGGPPGASEQVDAEYFKRSPINHLEKAKGVNLDINAGSVDMCVVHSLRAFNSLADVNGFPGKKLTLEEIRAIGRKRGVPREIESEKVEDETDRKLKVQLRRTAGPVRLTVFGGGHGSEMLPALNWLSRQEKE
jgi:hypothetical protein